MINRGRWRAPYLGRTLWLANHEKTDNALVYSGLVEWGWYDPGDQGVEDSGNATRPASGVSTTQAHSGTKSMRMQINTSVDKAGCRSFNSYFTSTGATLVHTAWYYFTSQLTATVGYQIMQLKNKLAGGASDVAWKLVIKNPAAGRMQLKLAYELGNGFNVLGPHAGEDNRAAILFYDPPIDFPDSQWVKVQMFVKQAVGYDGRITIWQDNVKTFDISGVNTKDLATSTNTWSVNNYGEGTTPSTFVLYIDDVSIGTRRV